MSAIALARTFVRSNWLVLLVIFLMISTAVLVGHLVHSEQQQAIEQEAGAAQTQQGSLAASSAVAVADTRQTQGEQQQDEKDAQPPENGPAGPLVDTPERIIARSALRLNVWSLWIGIFIGLVGSLIGLKQLSGSPERTGSSRNCLILEASREDLGCHVLHLVNVGRGPLSLGSIDVSDGVGRSISTVAGTILRPGRRFDLVVVPAHGTAPLVLDVVVSGDIDGRGLTARFEHDPAFGYLLRRHVEA